VDRSYVLASRYFDRDTSYVALSRHPEAATLYYGQDEFANSKGEGRGTRSRSRQAQP